MGVISADLRLTQISDFLRRIQVSQSGKIFIVERDGLIIGSSSSELPYTIVNGKAQRLNFFHSRDRLIQSTAQYLQTKFGSLKQIQQNQQLEYMLAGNHQFVQVTPWHDKYGLDWLVVVVVPESDFMAQINANTHTTILLCLGALVTATAIGVYTSRWITRPIFKLSRASQAIASGNLDQTVTVKGIQELDTLAKSFNQLENSTYHVRFQIEDTGVGMAAEQLTKIFVPFEQVGDNKYQAQGTGLGLTISQKIISLMNSKIQVTSQPEKGSIFWFDLEFLEATKWSDTARLKSQGKIIGFHGDKRKILVVDDRWENRSVLVSLLKPIGFEIAEASNGREGLEKALQFYPNLIITDIVMPLMDGCEMLRQIRASEQLSEVIAIASSASAFETDRYRSLTAGANEFLPKPVQAETLLEMLRLHLELSWIYEHQETKLSLSIQESASQLQELELPSIEILNRLYELVKKGDLDEILTVAHQLEASNSKYMFFAREIIQLTESFQVKQLRKTLQNYIEIRT